MFEWSEPALLATGLGLLKGPEVAACIQVANYIKSTMDATTVDDTQLTRLIDNLRNGPHQGGYEGPRSPRRPGDVSRHGYSPSLMMSPDRPLQGHGDNSGARSRPASASPWDRDRGGECVSWVRVACRLISPPGLRIVGMRHA